jgi:hypothetical protein
MICALLSTASTRVLLNRSPGARVANRRGLRQGDPLSPPAIHLGHGGLTLCFGEGNSTGAFGPLASTGLRQRTSIYADDVVAFL